MSEKKAPVEHRVKVGAIESLKAQVSTRKKWLGQVAQDVGKNGNLASMKNVLKDAETMDWFLARIAEAEAAAAEEDAALTKTLEDCFVWGDYEIARHSSENWVAHSKMPVAVKDPFKLFMALEARKPHRQKEEQK